MPADNQVIQKSVSSVFVLENSDFVDPPRPHDDVCP